MTRPLDIWTSASHPGAAAEVDALTGLRREILRLTAPVLDGAGIPIHRVVCHLRPAAGRLDVQFELPTTVPAAVKQALAVRVLDAVRGAGRTFGHVEVSVFTR